MTSSTIDEQRARVRILLDLTTAYFWRGKKAVGITRTEREIAIRLLSDPGLNVLPLKFHNGRLHALDPQFARLMLRECEASHAAPTQTTLPAQKPAESLPPVPQRSSLARAIGPFASMARAGVRLGLRAIPETARPEVALSLVHMREAVRRLIYPSPAEPPQVVPPSGAGGIPTAPGRPPEPDLSLVIHPRPGDVLLTCGLGWDHLDWAPIAALRAQQHMRVVCVCYDIIPLLFPKWIPAIHDLYLSHFLSMIDIADEVPCISRCTERDLRAFAAARGRPAPSTHVVYLGANLPAAPSPEGIDPHLAERFTAGRFALAVGTFEVRKNYGLLLDVWDRLTEDPEFDLDLVIVGMRGWEANDVIARLEASPLYRRRIFWLSNLDDAALSWLYERCHVALYASLYEGWGLPVVEALQHRRPVIASNRGAVPEAGLGVATIIDPDDLAAWCDAVAEAARHPRTETPPVTPPNWDDAAAMIRGILLGTVRTAERGAA